MPHVRATSGTGWGLLAAICWAGSTTFARFGTINGLTPLDLTVLRFATAGLVLAPAFLGERTGRAASPLRGRQILALVATAGPPYALLVASGFRFAPLVHGAILFPTATTVAAVVLGVWGLGEPFGRRGIAGTLLLLAGLGLVLDSSGGNPASGLPWIGDALFVAAGMVFGTYGYLLRRWRIGAWQATSTVAVVSMPICIAMMVLMPGRTLTDASLRDIALQVAVQGLGAGVIASIAFSQAVHRLGSARAGLFAAIVPAFALLIGLPLLQETPTVAQGAGLVLVTVGLVFALLKGGSEGQMRPDPRSNCRCSS